jgi:hypothetical protein
MLCVVHQVVMLYSFCYYFLILDKFLTIYKKIWYDRKENLSAFIIRLSL